MTTMTVQDALKWGNERLSNSFREPMIETRALLSGLLKMPLTQLFLKGGEELSKECIVLYQELIRRRHAKEPVAYLLREKNFMGLEMEVTPAVLIPRPETELLAQEALNIMGHERGVLLDIGTGSGCLAVTLAQKLSQIEVFASDVSLQALKVARRNAERHNVQSKIRFFHSDLYRELGPEYKGHFDMIVSNPPYISTQEMTQLETDVIYEPELALHGGKDGMDVIRLLIQNAGLYLKTTGTLLVEIGSTQGAAVSRLFEQAGFSDVFIIKDFNQHDRIVKGRWNGSI